MSTRARVFETVSFLAYFSRKSGSTRSVFESYFSRPHVFGDQKRRLCVHGSRIRKKKISVSENTRVRLTRWSCCAGVRFAPCIYRWSGGNYGTTSWHWTLAKQFLWKAHCIHVGVAVHNSGDWSPVGNNKTARFVSHCEGKFTENKPLGQVCCDQPPRGSRMLRNGTNKEFNVNFVRLPGRQFLLLGLRAAYHVRWGGSWSLCFSQI